MVVLFLRYKETWLKRLVVLFFRLAGYMLIVLWLYAFLVRMMHSGEECCGDLIVSKTKAKNMLYVEGMFIKFSSLLVFFIILLYVMGNAINFY
mmetsp:Transcript_24482/g.32810  ORF Transcript_24482/g.32810 Transcript_24482/m.32810 type:complete len:93 (+) Transcript_24482:309-587(+)